MIMKITNYKEKKLSSNLNQNNSVRNNSYKKLTDSNQTTHLSFRGLNSNKLSETIVEGLGSKFRNKFIHIAEESVNSIKNVAGILKGSKELPFTKKPLVAPDTLLDLELLAESGDAKAAATYATVKNLIKNGVHISKSENLFTSDGLINTSAAHDFASTIMNRAQIPTSEMDHLYPDTAKGILSNINEHMASGNLKTDIQYLDDIKNNIKFDSMADKLFDPEHRTNLRYIEMKFDEKYPVGSFFNAEKALDAKETALLMEHPELIGTADPTWITNHPELAKQMRQQLVNDHINDAGIEHAEGISHGATLTHFNNYIGEKMQVGSDHLHNLGTHFSDSTEHLIDGAKSYISDFGEHVGDNFSEGFGNIANKTQNLFGDFKPHIDLPEFKIPGFDLSFGDAIDDMRNLLEHIWDSLT